MTTPRFSGCWYYCQSRSGENIKRRRTITKSSNPISTSKSPSHAAYHIQDNKGGKSYWSRISSAWQHADGNGFNIEINTVPLDGRIELRVITEKSE